MSDQRRNRIYSVDHRNVAAVYVSEKGDGRFYGTILYQRTDFHFTNPVSGTDYNFEVQSFLADSEQDILSRSQSWLRENFDDRVYEFRLVD